MHASAASITASSSRPRALQPQARSAHAHALDARRRQQRDVPARSRRRPADSSIAPCADIGTCWQHAFARGDGGERLRQPAADRDRVEQRHRIGVRRQRLAHIDPQRGRQRCRCIAAGTVVTEATAQPSRSARAVAGIAAW